MVAQGEDELLEELNEGLKEAIEDGTYAKVYEKWFHHKPPKSILGDSRSQLTADAA